MKFSELTYSRPDTENYKKEYLAHLKAFAQAKTFALAEGALEELNKLRNHMSTLSTLAHIRFTINTKDDFYRQEQEFFDSQTALFEELSHNYYQVLLGSPFLSDFEKKYGKQLIDYAQCHLKTFSPQIAEDLNQESELTTQYTKLIAQAEIHLDGKTLNLSQLAPYLTRPEREVRLRAQQAKYAFFEKNQEELDDIYHRLVQLRHQMALKLGYPNFVPLGYARMGRTAYNPEHVAAFRNYIKESFLPLCQELIEEQKKRLCLGEEFAFYDEPLKFPEGNPQPRKNKDELVEIARKMYSELSEPTKIFIELLFDGEFVDLESRAGKAGGGYCTYLPDYQMPFIFANFNGTQYDVEVLTHEAGHAFQMYESRHFKLPEYLSPTLEACEIHSMSMEFLTYPWMELFFDKEAEKFRLSHLSDAITFLPYAALVDEFQHVVYENPEFSPQQRKKMYRELEKIYLPHRNYASFRFPEEGGYWQQQSHIYTSPFYYIDYALAQICALQFYLWAETNRDSSWEAYLRVCRAGGSLNFPEIVALGNLESPFNAPRELPQKLFYKLRAYKNTIPTP
ncbi:MAG: M3 family oligoendopeptidase [Leptospiraceae bacterium]|nr:M3 family oligoendopeptidase [Leptospiraceae bacterium]MDW8305656.1 M3 family oligoendopeptidase [Leptospiraceae bacterium]